MRFPRTAGGAVVFVICIIVGIAVRMNHKSSAGKEVLEEMRMVVAQCSEYQKNQEYMDYILEDVHEELFSKCYTPGFGRGSQARFDEDRYVENIFPMLIARASQDGSKHIAEALQKLQRGLDEVPKEKTPPPAVRSRTGSR